MVLVALSGLEQVMEPLVEGMGMEKSGEDILYRFGANCQVRASAS